MYEVEYDDLLVGKLMDEFRFHGYEQYDDYIRVCVENDKGVKMAFRLKEDNPMFKTIVNHFDAFESYDVRIILTEDRKFILNTKNGISNSRESM